MKRTIENTKKNISRNRSMAVVTILVITVVFTIATLLFALGVAFRNAVKYYEKRSQVIVFFKQETPEEEIFKFRDLINDVDRVESIEYTSKQEAIEIHKKDFEEYPELLETITLDTLPSSLGIRAKSIDQLQSLIEDISVEKEKNAYIDEILYFKNVVDTIKTLSIVINWGSVLFIVGLISISLFLISITIRLNILSHKKEIEIMHLVGSNEMNIKLPYIYEGAYYGVIGAFISSLIILIPWYVTLLLTQDSDFNFWITRMLTDLNLEILTTVNPLFIIIFILSLVIMGLILGSLSSLWAVNKYLDNIEVK